MNHDTDSAAAVTPPPLDGVKVLDLTSFLSGPFATQVLADLGADIVKVEPPSGDTSRTVPPYFVDGVSAYFLSANRGKRSITVDLKNPDGLRVVRALIDRADVVIDNYRPGVLGRLGIDVSEIRSKRPELIWASISGFGLHGEQSTLPAYDMIVQALSGVMSMTGEAGRPAVRLGIPAGDTVAGLYAVIGLLSALHRRETTGVGGHLDVSMLDCQLAMTSYQGAYASIGGAVPGPQGARHDSIATYRSFAGGDGREFVVTANSEKMWKSLAEVFGVPELVSDPRFTSLASRHVHREELWPLLEAAAATRPAAEIVDDLRRAGVPCALINTVPEALEESRKAGRSLLVELADERGNEIELVGNPVKFVGESFPAVATGYPPRLGQHTDELLRESGFDASEISEFIATNAVVGEGSRPDDSTVEQVV